MKRATCGVLLLAAVFLLMPVPSQAGGHGWRGHGGHGHGWYGPGWHSTRIHIGLGFPLWWGPRPGWWGPAPVHVRPAPVFVPPPRVVVMEQPVYVQREPVAALPPSYWYYCKSARGYYPDVPSCREPWVQVPPRIE